MRDDRPLVGLTMGDVAGIGPEVIARAWGESPLRTLARPVVIGSADVLERALRCVSGGAEVVRIGSPEEANPSRAVIPCLDATEQDLGDVEPGRIDQEGREGGAGLPFRGDRPGPGRPSGRDHDIAAEQGVAPRGGGFASGAHGDAGRALWREGSCHDALRRPADRLGGRGAGCRPRHAPCAAAPGLRAAERIAACWRRSRWPTGPCGH